MPISRSIERRDVGVMPPRFREPVAPIEPENEPVVVPEPEPQPEPEVVEEVVEVEEAPADKPARTSKRK